MLIFQPKLIKWLSMTYSCWGSMNEPKTNTPKCDLKTCRKSRSQMWNPRSTRKSGLAFSGMVASFAFARFPRFCRSMFSSWSLTTWPLPSAPRKQLFGSSPFSRVCGSLLWLPADITTSMSTITTSLSPRRFNACCLNLCATCPSGRLAPKRLLCYWTSFVKM